MSTARPLFDPWRLVQALTWLILIVCLFWPLSAILSASFVDNDTGALTLANYREVIETRAFRRAFVNTLIAGFGGMIGSLVIGITLAFIVARHRIVGSRTLELLAILALVSPPFIGAYAWIVLFGANGVVRNWLGALGFDVPPIFGVWGVILVFSMKFFPHVFLMTSTALQSVNPSLEEAAENLGMPPGQRFFKVTLPLITPAIAASALLTFVLSIADFGTPRLIGRDFNVLATEAFTLFGAELGGNPGVASALSMALIAISLVLVAAQRWAVRRDVFGGNMIRKPAPKLLTGVKNLAYHLIAYAIVLFGTIPAITAVIFSFRRTSGPVFQPGFGLDSYHKVFAQLSTPILNTLVFSAIAVVLIVAVGTLIGYLLARRPSAGTALLDGALMVPYIVPGIVMGIAYITRFNTPPLAITGTAAVIILVIFIRRLPYAARSVASALRQVSPRVEEAAISLGAPPMKAFFKTTVPLIAPGILSGALMSLVTAMNELSSSLVLYVGGTATMPVRIYLAVLDGEYGTASALATILLALTALAVLIAFRLAESRGAGQASGARLAT